MNIKIKYGLIVLTISIFALIGFIGLGFYTMEIEDQYGDYQELFYKVESNDIIINKSNLNYGVIEKSWKRINIKQRSIDSTDLYQFIKDDYSVGNFEIYRPLNRIDISNANYSDLENLIKNNRLKLIFKR
ncbi:hypothetical protein JM79_2138 [Gramella sp. Hel_I_59]|uniref:hypothetical protein n=1 Tax=Gramella sp. Hel_I_59 TaxID=1249978 RepID=UPI0011543C34|nr:hypothetical protein [Gramella sp. Hel_I_59]TQI71211.1 hypothetical protein JM79_2138 [Gramella sp. Hel_I_59]